MIQKPFETYGFKLYFKTIADNTLRPSSSPSLSSGPFHYFVPIMLNLELLFFSWKLNRGRECVWYILRVHGAQTIPVPYRELLVLSYLECENPLSDLTAIHKLPFCTF